MTENSRIQELIAALKSSDLTKVLDAVDALGTLKAVEAVPLLIDLLDHEDFQVRLAAIQALGEIGDERAIPRLGQIVVIEIGPIQSAAGSALLRMGTPDALAAMESLRDGDTYKLGAPLMSGPLEEAEADERLDDLLLDDELFRNETFGGVLQEEAGETPAPPVVNEPAPPPNKPEVAQARGIQVPEQEEAAPDAKKAADLEPPEPAPARPVEAPPPPSAAPGSVPLPEIQVPSPSVIPQPARPIPQPSPPPRQRESQSRTQTGSSSGTLDDALQAAVQQVQFSAYYPREVQPDEWRPLQAYVFKAFAADKVATDAEKQIGPLNVFRRILASARQVIPEGALITAQPILPGFQFNPPSVTVGFYEDWHRFEFKMRAKDAPLNQAANGMLTFMANGIIVADVPLSVFVTPEAQQTTPQPSASQPMYDTIFASYSHRDMQIVERVEAAAKALGMTYLRDVVTLRSGQHWSEELLKMIDDATIFQLFWSETAAQSPYCKQEWEYALKLNRDNQYFIRPVYWNQPMPNPPTNLQHLHFAYQPDSGKVVG